MAQENALRIVESSKDFVEESLEEDDSGSEENLVRRCVREFCDLHNEMHNHRENLIALGVPTQTVTVLIEMGFNGRTTEQEKLMKSCLKDIGGGHVDEKVLTNFKAQMHELTNLERDMAHSRKIARQSGLSLPALNALTNMIRQNPGDGGAKVVNSFLAYAMAADIPLDQIEEILKTASEKPKSVLPVIESNEADEARRATISLARDVLLGIVLTASLMWALT